jgi:beta-galactosidase
MRLRLAWTFAILLPVLSHRLHAQDNLALQATDVDASDESPNHGPRQAVDGSVGSYWEVAGSKSRPAWVEISWKDPITIRELVLRRYDAERGAPDITHLKVESFQNGVWRELQQIGDGKTPLPKLIYQRISEQAAQKLRLSGFDAKALIREIEVYSKSTPAWIDIRGDARNNMIGVLTDGFGSTGISEEVQISGHAGGKVWKATARTGLDGDFTVAMPSGLAGPVEFIATVNGETVRKTVDAGDIHQGLVPAASESLIELNGTWKFMPDPPAGFERPELDDTSWKPIQVPSHWAMAGFTAGKDGGYRRHVNLPSNWQGRRIRIAFDAVYSGAEVWWNGRRVGSHLGGATPFQLDVSAAAKTGDNVIAVRVAQETIASRMDHMSMYADFPLAGIMRRVYVFSVPALHVQRQQSHAEFDSEYKNAELVTELSVANESASSIAGASARLTLMLGDRSVGTSEPIALEMPAWSRVERTVKLQVANPEKWNSEHPNLYTLQTIISKDGGEIERLVRKVGFRETHIDKTALVIDGKPIKLKGTAHHDSDPVLGRAITPAIERHDLELMKEANIDSLRTSHYPQLPELFDIADELGLYVEDEAPFCWVDEAYDLRWGALTRQLTAELVERDLSHPSVAYWSAGNESDWGPILDMGAREMRAHDPSRPVMGSWTNNLDFKIRHNPISVAGIHALAGNDKPVLWDESLAPYQGIYHDGEAIWRDPGIRDYYVEPLVDVLDAFWKSKVIQASFIWAWSDDMFLVPGRGSEYGRSFTESHGIDRLYYKDGHGLVGDAPWGVIDGWRRKKPEFWHIKKLYSPVHVTARSLPLPSSGTVQVPVTNRYFFSNLSELSVKWKGDGQEGTVTSDIGPQNSGTIEIPVGAAVASGSQLEIRFLRGNELVDIESIELGEIQPVKPASVKAGPLRRHDQELLSGITPRIDGDDFSLGLSGRRGLLQYFLFKNTNILYDQPQVHVLPSRASTTFPETMAWTLDHPLETLESNGNLTILSQGHYSNLIGSYRTVISPEGDVTISADFSYAGPDVLTKEIGFQFDVPLALDRLSWQRKGEWTWYPEDHIGALSGDVQAHSGKAAFTVPTWPYAEDDSPMGSNMYRSTKRNILSATVRDQAGRGWTIHSDGSQHLRASEASDRISIFVSDWYGGSTADMGEYVENYGDGKMLHTGDRIHSTLRLSPLRGGAAQ